MRRANRIAAYAVSIAAFSIYHVWGYAISEPSYWLYLIEYVPASYVLCRCYERTDTIWASMILHFGINGIALKAVGMLQDMM